jgi:hypothetical protein
MHITSVGYAHHRAHCMHYDALSWHPALYPGSTGAVHGQSRGSTGALYPGSTGAVQGHSTRAVLGQYRGSTGVLYPGSTGAVQGRYRGTLPGRYRGSTGAHRACMEWAVGCAHRRRTALTPCHQLLALQGSQLVKPAPLHQCPDVPLQPRGPKISHTCVWRRHSCSRAAADLAGQHGPMC